MATLLTLSGLIKFCFLFLLANVMSLLCLFAWFYLVFLEVFYLDCLNHTKGVGPDHSSRIELIYILREFI